MEGNEYLRTSWTRVRKKRNSVLQLSLMLVSLVIMTVLWPEPVLASAGLDVVFVIDNSGSMDSNDRQYYRVNGTLLSLNKLGADDQAGLVRFSTSVTDTQELTTNKALVSKSANRIRERGTEGGTNINAGVAAALTMLETDTRGNVDKYIFVLTDGVNTSASPPLSEINQRAQAGGIKIFTIGLGSSLDENFLRQLAENNGGCYVHAASEIDLAG